MKLIPAIDLMNGAVVHARGGTRRQYRPLHNRFFPYSTPIKVIQTILKFIAADTFYLADLNAINKEGDHRDTIAAIVQHFPQLEFWVDQGISEYAQLAALKMPPSMVAVVGSETLNEDLSHFAGIHYILSLDFKSEQLLGHDVLSQIPYWPQRVIALSLDRVGSRRGPHLSHLRQLRSLYHGELYAGGGIQNRDDIKVLSDIGIAGVLLADSIYHHRL